MKRSSLARRSPLRAVSAKQQRHLRAVDAEPGRKEFKRVWQGRCAVCGAEGLVRRHHVIQESAVRRANGNPWDLANSLVVGIEWTCRCHGDHHNASKRIPMSLISNDTLEFAAELLGKDRMALYLASHYEGNL